MSPSRDFHIPSLDGIRGIAALIVFLAHAGLAKLIPGGFGVTIFFFLSGYLITTLLRMEYQRAGTIALGSFYLRRAYRILPPMYIVLVGTMTLALLGVIPHNMSVAGVLSQFAHFTNYYYVLVTAKDFVPATGVMWSLAVEEHFYLVFPLTLLLLLRRFTVKRAAMILLIGCGLVLAWRCYVTVVLHWSPAYVYRATDTRMDSLLYGCILGLWLNPVLDRTEHIVSRRAAAGLICVGAALLLVSFAYREPVFRETLRYSLQGIGLFALFFCAVRHHDWPLFAWLDSSPMRALGLISYTFYLVHIPCLVVVGRHTNLSTPVRAVVGFCLTLLISAMMYYFVERHLATLRRRLHRRSSSTPERRLAATEQQTAP